MADNFSFDSNGNILGSPTFASDDISGTQHGRVKIQQGADGTASDVSSANPLYVVDPFLEISKGSLTGHSPLNKFGWNGSIAAAATEEVWDGSAAYVYPATALMTSMSQTADQVAMRGATIEWQGLDVNGDLVTQTKSLDASDTTTVITLDTALWRVFRGKVLADVVGDSDIRCHNAGETQDYAIITAGNNQTQMAMYTVPNGKTLYVTNYYCQNREVSGGGLNDHIVFSLWAADRDNSYEFQLKHSKGMLYNVNDTEHSFQPYMKFTQKTDIKITASPTGFVAEVWAGFDGIVVDN